LGHAPATVQVAVDVAHVVFGRDDLDLHDRLEQHGLRLLRTFLERHRARDLERDLARVDVVVRAVVERDLDVDDGVAGDHAVLHLLLDALVDGRNVLLRNDAADDRVDELVARPRLLRLDTQVDMAVLAAAARLTDELAFLLDRLPDRLAIRDLRLPDVRVDLDLAPHTVDDDVEVQLAHAGDD